MRVKWLNGTSVYIDVREGVKIGVDRIARATFSSGSRQI